MGSLQSPPTVQIDAIVRTNQLLLSGTRSQVDEALSIVEQLDVENELELRTYQFRFTSAQRIDDLIRKNLQAMDDKQVERLYQATVNEQTNQLIATTRAEIHTRIEALKRQLDVQEVGGPGQSPMRFYKLKNVKAIEILDTLQSIERRVTAPSRTENRLNGINPSVGFVASNMNLRNQNAITRNSFGSDSELFDPFGLGPPSPGLGREAAAPGSPEFGNTVVGDLARLASGLNLPDTVIPGKAKLTVDENTNTLIVVAAPSIQKLYADLIEKLDVRRPQVLIEVTVVVISGQDDMSFGIEISGGDRIGLKQLYALTNFGLSDPDALPALSIIPGLGFNGTLVDPEVADVVVRALARHRRARVLSAPRILVNDNATGLVSSVAEVPFASINAGNTVSTNSLGGFAQAGTTISVTPQISDDDYLNLEFDILVNNFSGAATTVELPPPRNTDQVTSEVRIPDGHTVIVGGLTRRRFAGDLAGLPIIEKIPILNRLTSAQTEEDENQRLFVFIKPIILRDDKFRDLRFLSDTERRQACIPEDLPSSSPVLIR